MAEFIAKLNIFSNDTGSEIKCILSKFADGTNLSDAVDSLYRKNATLGRFEDGGSLIDLKNGPM